MWLHVPSTSSVCAPGLGGSILPLGSHAPGLASSVMWKGKPMEPRSLRRAWKRAPWIRRLSGLISAPSTAEDGVESWISSLAAGRANPHPLRGLALATLTLDGCGTTWSGSWTKSNPDGSLARTWPVYEPSLVDRLCVHMPSRWEVIPQQRPLFGPGSHGFSGILSKAGSMQSSCIYERAPWEPPTQERGSSSWGTRSDAWPAPTANNGTKSIRTPEGAQKEAARKGWSNDLSVAAVWQTPVADDACRRIRGKWNSRGEPKLSAQVMLPHWPTPTAGDARGSGSRNTPGSKAHAGLSLTDFVRGDGGTGRGKRGDVWPTPAAVSYGTNQGGAAGRVGPVRHSLETMAGRGMLPSLPMGREIHDGEPCSESADGSPRQSQRLNPLFVAWMMSWPIWWVATAPMPFARAEMASWRSRARQHLLSLLGGSSDV